MRRLIIIGNGFDGAHNLPTSYYNFKEFVKRRDYHFYESISRYISEDYLWSTFEKALGKLDETRIQEDNSSYLLGYGDDNWSDSAHHDFQYMIQQELEFSSLIPDYLEEWIKSINTDARPVVSGDTINRHCIFLNFNYTDTLERIYGIPEEKILYIHGKAIRDDKLIVGHHDITKLQKGGISAFNAPEKHGRYLSVEDEDVRVTEALEIIKDYFRATYKDTESIIEENRQFFDSLADINKVFILGHSLSDIDMDYFVEVLKCVSPGCQWYISHHTRDDLKRIQWFESNFDLYIHRVKIEDL